jgi:hypothetical protein
MRKVSLLTTALLLLGSFALFAQMNDEGSGLPFEISGDATVTFGYNLDSGGMGFTNSSSSSVSVTLVGEQSSSAGEGDSWHGWIELSDFQIKLDSDDLTTITAPGVEAKIISGPLWIRVFDNDGMSIGQVSIVEDDADDDYGAQGDDDGLDIAPDLTDAGGTSVGFSNDMLSVAGHIASETTWEDPATPDDGWSVGVDGSATFGPITVKADVIIALEQDNNLFGAGIGLALDLPLGDTMNLAVSGGADLQDDDVSEMIMEFGGTLTLELSETTSLGAAFISGVVATEGGPDTDLEVTFAEDGGMVENLTVNLLFGLYNLIDGGGDEILLSADLGYGLTVMEDATLTPALGVDYSSTDGVDTIGVEVSATLAGAIPNTEFVLTWATADVENNSGNLTFATTVSY